MQTLDTSTDAYYTHMAELLRKVLHRFSIPSPIANDIAAAGVGEIRKSLRGNTVYFSAISKKDRQARKAKIRAEYNGKNHRDICRRHGISRTTLYRLLNEPAKTQANDLA